MKQDEAYLLDEQQRITGALSDTARTIGVLRVEAEDTISVILQTVQRLSHPFVLLVLTERGTAFRQGEHFEHLQQFLTASPRMLRFVIPPRCVREAQLATRYGFQHANSLEEALRFFVASPFPHTPLPPLLETAGPPEAMDRSAPPSREARASMTNEPPRPASLPQASWSGQAAKRQRVLALSFLALLLAVSVLLLPQLLNPPQTGTAHLMTVGLVAFSSSGQLDPLATTGINDTITVQVHDLPLPASGNRYSAWLLPDAKEGATRPLLLGTVPVQDGSGQLVFSQPHHQDLLAHYSGVRLTEEPATHPPLTASPNPATWRAEGWIPDVPTPGDEAGYSLLDHLRHLLAQDPTLEHIGLSGGLGIWFERNSQKVVEWASAARDDWQTAQTPLLHRQIIRILDYLDGSVYVAHDVPSGSPWLVDPHAGQIGLLTFAQNQEPPAYLAHIALHLEGVINAPGHTPAERQRAIQIHAALDQVQTHLEHVRQDAFSLVKMDAIHLRQPTALSLLDDLDTQATEAYVGTFDPQTGETTGGALWIDHQLQALAVIPLVMHPHQA